MYKHVCFNLKMHCTYACMYIHYSCGFPFLCMNVLENNTSCFVHMQLIVQLECIVPRLYSYEIGITECLAFLFHIS